MIFKISDFVRHVSSTSIAVIDGAFGTGHCAVGLRCLREVMQLNDSIPRNRIDGRGTTYRRARIQHSEQCIEENCDPAGDKLDI